MNLLYYKNMDIIYICITKNKNIRLKEMLYCNVKMDPVTYTVKNSKQDFFFFKKYCKRKCYIIVPFCFEVIVLSDKTCLQVDKRCEFYGRICCSGTRMKGFACLVHCGCEIYSCTKLKVGFEKV